MAQQRYADDELKSFRVPSFSKGYNSYTASNTLVDDQEFPQGQNVYLDNNGAASKVQGSSRFTSSEIASGHAIFGMGWLKNTSHNKVIAASNTAWYRVDTGTGSALTGMAFTADKATDFAQAIDRLYGANNTDNLAWTSDGAAITEVSANGNIGRWPVSYNRRLYMTNAANPDRIYYSNPYGIDLGSTYTFTVSSANATVGATYTNNGSVYTVSQTIVGATTLITSGTGTPEASGTLTKSGGTGDATITFSAVSGGTVTYSTTYFGTFDTSLNTNIPGGNKKNAGFIILLPGAGVVITGLKLDSYAGTDYIYASTKRHGTWRIAYSSTNSDGTLVHTISQIDTTIGSPSGRSLVKVGNDIWLYGRDNFYTIGEVAQYANLRVSPKAGRVQSEVNSIASSGISMVVGGLFNNKLYYAYQVGSYNDRILIYDVILNAWSAPRIGVNASCFLLWEDDTGTQHFLSGSSYSGDSRIYELATGTNDAGGAISANFTTKSYDCKLPGLVKRFAFIDVFYSLVYGTLTYEVFLNEESSITGSLQLGSSASSTSGIGSQPIGNFVIGGEYSGDSTGILRYGKFRIPCQYRPGDTISIKFSNNNADETFKINGFVCYFLPGDLYEEIA